MQIVGGTQALTLGDSRLWTSQFTLDCVRVKELAQDQCCGRWKADGPQHVVYPNRRASYALVQYVGKVGSNCAREYGQRSLSLERSADFR